MKVLIADDDLVSRRVLEGYLQKWDYQVTVATDGAEAWEMFQAEEFPIVICDWMMPEMDGPQLIKRIRSSDKPGYVYTLLLTGKSRKGDLVEGMQSGADDFVSKPFDHNELRMRLRAGERIIHLEQSLREAKATIEGNKKN
jgi:two-component system NtrC family sensor kinase